MKKLILMCGIPASGKSSFIKSHNFGDNTLIVSRDKIRFSMLREGDSYFAREKEVYRKYVQEIKEGLSTYDIVIADATHLNEKSRRKILNALGNSLQNIEVNVIFLKVPLAEALRRNESRVGVEKVPPAAMENMSKSLVEPSFDEFNYAHIYIWSELSNPKLTIKEMRL